MNAIVEVETATAVAHAEPVIVMTFTVTATPKVDAVIVSTSPLHVVSQGNHSISAVAPDNNFEGEQLAVA